MFDSELRRLRQRKKTGPKPLYVFITGSSGMGKTHITHELAQHLPASLATIHNFDSVGVPSTESMIAEWGSPEQWQRAMVDRWVGDLANDPARALILLEGQFQPSFVQDACQREGLLNYRIVCFYCDEAVWTARLRGPRKQPELVTDDMRNWSKHLKNEVVKIGGHVIDTSDSNSIRIIRELLSAALGDT